MIPFSGLLFFYLLFLGLLPAVVLGLLGKKLHYHGIFLCAAMLVIVFWQNGQLAALALFFLWEMALCCLFWRLPKRTRPLLWAAVILALGPLGLIKLGEVWQPFSLFRLMGASYMSFRALQVLLDIYDGRLQKLRPVALGYFLLFFPAVSSGPIDRYRRFLSDLDRPPDREHYRTLLAQGIWKLAGGCVSAVVVSGFIQQYWLAALPESGFGATLSYMYGYTFYLFFNFAGYSSMAIGTGYLLGIQMPENFNQPFLSVDMKDFWSRWHISLSTWLRDYLYSRFVMKSLKQKRFSNPRTASYLGYVLNMMAMGAWHGLQPQYLLYGVYHSALMCLNEVLDLHCKSFRSFKTHGAGQVVCVLVTFHLFSFGLLIFSGRLI
mgnify:FL=1